MVEKIRVELNNGSGKMYFTFDVMDKAFDFIKTLGHKVSAESAPDITVYIKPNVQVNT